MWSGQLSCDTIICLGGLNKVPMKNFSILHCLEVAQEFVLGGSRVPEIILGGSRVYMLGWFAKSFFSSQTQLRLGYVELRLCRRFDNNTTNDNNNFRDSIEINLFFSCKCAF